MPSRSSDLPDPEEPLDAASAQEPAAPDSPAGAVGSPRNGPQSAFEMTEESDPSSVIEDLLDRWEEAQEAGKAISVEELCISYPRLLPEVRSRIARLQAIDGRIGSAMPSGADQAMDLSEAKLPIVSTIEELEFLQRGGLGAVYVGEDMVAHRRVAVKFLHGHLACDPLCRERFALEAEVTARLEHPGVIPLYGIGENDTGDPFYAMRFIDGHSMDEAIRDLYGQESGNPLIRVEQDRRYRKLLNDFVSVCKTIAYAHNRGIVHRDIKPANVMLGRYGETIVVDWGLAVPVIRDETFRQSGEATLMPVTSGDSSTSGQGAGTPVYMSPEQASKLAPTPASDIYSLGATLYKILSGKTAVDGNSIVEIKEKVIDGRVKPLRDVRASVPPPLASIAQRAMALKPTDRYRTALAMAEDVEAFLADESVSAHQESWPSKIMRLTRRHRSATQTAVIALSLGAILAAFAFVTLGAYATRETFLRKDAEAAKGKATEAQQNAERLGRESLALSAQFLAKSIANEIDLRWRILEAEAASPRLRDLVLSLNERLPDVPVDPNREGNVKLLSTLEKGPLELQSWLQARYINNQYAVKTESWVVQSGDGTQVARVPIGNSIGRNFRHRDYFHGLGYDLSPSEASDTDESMGPLSGRIVHMSAAYESTNTGTLKVSFSVPIHDGEVDQPNRNQVGVVGMSIEVGDFAMDGDTWLVDTRADQFKEQKGMLLQHPNLGQRSQDDVLPHLSNDVVDRLIELRRRRVVEMRAAQNLSPDGVILDIIDPVDETDRTVAVEPVIIRGRPDRIADTGWIVVVVE
ncbi:MAG: serine/threonine-protein kinase [Planctomycetota bacterium]